MSRRFVVLDFRVQGFCFLGLGLRVGDLGFSFFQGFGGVGLGWRFGIFCFTDFRV